MTPKTNRLARKAVAGDLAPVCAMPCEPSIAPGATPSAARPLRARLRGLHATCLARGRRGAPSCRAGALAALAALGCAAPSSPWAAQPAAAELLDCMIQPHQIVQVGAPAAGVVEQVLVERGDLVQRGQVLVQLQAQVERAALALARERSQQAGEVRSASGARALAERELERANELMGENFVSRTFVDRARAEAEVAGGRTEQAQERQRLAARELELANAQLAQRTIRAPIAGVVMDRFVSVGEFVEQKPLLRVASIDPLRVDVLVPATAFGQVSLGQKGRVVPELAGHQGAREAVVKSVDRVIDAASNTFRVRLELANPKAELPAGLRCKIDLGLKPAAPAAAPRSSPAAAAAATPPLGTALSATAPPGPTVAATATAATAAAAGGEPPRR